MTVSAATATTETARAFPLAEGERAEALDFLARRPLHAVIMAGMMREHGTRVPTPAGRFYACRDERGRLEGVALVGRATMFETRGEAALAAFAALARLCPSVRMIMGEEADFATFRRHFDDADGGTAARRPPRLQCRELFYDFSRPAQSDACAAPVGLRRAAAADLEQIVEAHAWMVFEESRVDPLAEDAEGFSRRCALRVERGKVWVLFEAGELIFKADVVAETPEASYIEGVWVNPSHRLKGYGRRCWSALSRALLARAPAFCGFVNDENPAARNFYERVGGRLLGSYAKVYL